MGSAEHQHNRYWSRENITPWLKKFFDFQRSTHPVWFDYIVSTNKKHGWHLVSRSPWPFWASCSALTLVMGLIFWMHKFQGLFKYNPVTIPSYLLWYGVFAVTGVIIFWFRDIIREAVYMGYHTTFVQGNLRLGFMLFIVSEVMFFASFFWAFFHSSIDPSIWNGSIWPPAGIVNFFISEDISQLLVLPTLASIAETFFTSLPSIIKGDFFLPFLTEILNIASFINSNYILYFSDKVDTFFDHMGINWRVVDDVNSNTFLPESYAEDLDSLSAAVFNSSFDAVHDEILEKNMITLAVELLTDDSVYTNNSHYVSRDIGDTDSNSNSLNLNLYDCGTLIKPYRLPLINTFILLTSGALLTWSHKSLRVESFKEALGSLGGVILFAAAFVIVQFHEYLLSAFSINDGIFGSTFFMLTGFHGIHVMIGSIFLIVCAFRFLLIHFTRAHHFGYEAAIWYWHSVDVVWVFLYLFVYFWPSNFFFDYSFNWNSVLPTNFDFALPTKFLTYLTDSVLDYPFHLIEKYAEIKANVFKRFSLSLPSLIIMGGADEFSLFTNTDDVIVDTEDENFLDNFAFINYFYIPYEELDCFDDYLTFETEVWPNDIFLTEDTYSTKNSGFISRLIPPIHEAGVELSETASSTVVAADDQYNTLFDSIPKDQQLSAYAGDFYRAFDSYNADENLDEKYSVQPVDVLHNSLLNFSGEDSEMIGLADITLQELGSAEQLPDEVPETNYMLVQLEAEGAIPEETIFLENGVTAVRTYHGDIVLSSASDDELLPQMNNISELPVSNV